MKRKFKSTTFLLCCFLGVLGVHRFYLNTVLSGILMLVAVPLLAAGAAALL